MSSPKSIPAETPLLAELPFAVLDPARFEDFVADLMSYEFPKTYVSRLGRNGHRQHGLDIIQKQGELYLRVAQCKRVDNFTLSDFKAVIRNVKLGKFAELPAEVPKHLALSLSGPSPELQLAADANPGWEIHDARTLSMRVRRLPTLDAIRLVETYFPGFRESFLGFAAPSPWLEPSIVFSEVTDGLFHHKWELVGRTDEVIDAVEFLASTDNSIYFVAGPGGYGKTRLLQAISSRLSEIARVVILDDPELATPETIEMLPANERLVIVIDDAQRSPQLASKIRHIWRRCPTASFLIATRPYGLNLLLSKLAENCAQPARHQTLKLDKLSLTETIDLAQQAIGPNGSYTDACLLAQVTQDLPLATVVGGQLLASGQISVSSLSSNPHVKRDILSRFIDDAIPYFTTLEKFAARKFLEILSAIQPLNLNNESEVDAVAELLGIEQRQLQKVCNEAVQIGVVKRVGLAHRVVPDLLGEMLLYESICDAELGLDTKFIDFLIPKLPWQSLANLFVNANRAAPQQDEFKAVRATGIELLWDWLDSEFAENNLSRNINALHLLKSVADVRPDKVILLATKLIKNSAKNPPLDSPWSSLPLSTSRSLLLDELIPALQLAGQSTVHQRPALELLRDSWRELTDIESHSAEKAQKAIQHALEFEYFKPIVFNKVALQTVLSWRKSDFPESIYPLLSPTVALEATFSYMDGTTIHLQSSALKREVIQPIRDEVINLAIQDLVGESYSEAGYALRFLTEALRPPFASYGRTISDEEQTAWAEDYCSAIGRIGGILSEDVDPVVFVGLRKLMAFQRDRGIGAPHDTALEVLSQFPDGPTFLLAEAVEDNGINFMRSDLSRLEAFEEQEAFLRRVLDSLAHLDDDSFYELVSTRISIKRLFTRTPSSCNRLLLRRFAEERPGFGELALASSISEGNFSPYNGPSIEYLLTGLAQGKPESAIRWLHRLFSVPAAKPFATAALAGFELDLLLSEEFSAILMELTNDPNDEVRRALVGVADYVRTADPSFADSMVERIKISHSRQILEALTFYYKFFPRSESSFREFLSSRITELIQIPILNEHRFIALLLKHFDECADLIDVLFRKRIEEYIATELKDYQPIPFELDEERTTRRQDFKNHLNHYLQWFNSGSIDDYKWRIFGSKLFNLLFSPWDGQLFDAIGELILKSSPKEREAMSEILYFAPLDVAWKEPESIARLISKVEECVPEYSQQLIDCLLNSTQQTSKVTTLGEPCAETLQQRDKCKEILKTCEPGSPRATLYSGLLSRAEAEIDHEITSAEFQDHRRWH